VFREQLQNNANKGMYFVKVNYEDLMNFDEGLASVVKNHPNDFLPLVRSADITLFSLRKPSSKSTGLTISTRMSPKMERLCPCSKCRFTLMSSLKCSEISRAI
jgi:hypothetical protein